MDLQLTDSMLGLLGAALVAAFLGGWHCAGMCGAIASLATNKRSVFFYQVGRLLSYVALGSLAAFAGGRIFQSIESSNRWWIGVIMAVLSFWIMMSTWKMQGLQKLQRWMWRNRPRRSQDAEYFSLGILNGLLPCHWLYGFLFLAAGLQSPQRGAALLFCLWLGSTPWLLGFSYFTNHVKKISGQASWAARIILAFVFLGLIAHQFAHSF